MSRPAPWPRTWALGPARRGRIASALALASSVVLDRSRHLLGPQFPSLINGDNTSTDLLGCSGSGPGAPAPPCSVGPRGVTSTRSRDMWRNGKRLFLTFLGLISLAESNSKRRMRFGTANINRCAACCVRTGVASVTKAMRLSIPLG